MKLDNIIALQFHLVSLLADEICGTASDIESHLYNVFVVADGGEEFRVCWDHNVNVDEWFAMRLIYNGWGHKSRALVPA